MSAPTSPLRSKHWTPDHIALASAAEAVRAKLRRGLPAMPAHLQAELATCCSTLTAALKNRQPRNPIPTGETNR